MDEKAKKKERDFYLAKAQRLQEEQLEFNKRIGCEIEQAFVAAGVKKEVTIDLDNPFNRPKESKLSISLRGHAEYLAKSGKEYRVKKPLREGTFPHKLLHLFACFPKKFFTQEEICKGLNMERETIDDDKVRFAMQDLRERFSLDRNNPDNFLIIKNKKYRINCISEIRD